MVIHLGKVGELDVARASRRRVGENPMIHNRAWSLLSVIALVSFTKRDSRFFANTVRAVRRSMGGRMKRRSYTSSRGSQPLTSGYCKTVNTEVHIYRYVHP